MNTRVALLFSLVIGLFACSDGNILAPRNFTRLDEAEARWKAHGIKQYTLTQRRQCYCGLLAYPLTLSIDSTGKIVRARDAKGDSINTAFGTSIESIFANIRAMQSRTDASFEVRYDSVYGYPRFLSADPIKQAIDDEYVLETMLVR